MSGAAWTIGQHRTSSIQSPNGNRMKLPPLEPQVCHPRPSYAECERAAAPSAITRAIGSPGSRPCPCELVTALRVASQVLRISRDAILQLRPDTCAPSILESILLCGTRDQIIAALDWHPELMVFRNSDDQTILTIAVTSRNLSAVRAIRRVAGTEQQFVELAERADKTGWTAMMYAAASGTSDMLAYLMDGKFENLSRRGRNGQTLTQLAACHGNGAVVQWLTGLSLHYCRPFRPDEALLAEELSSVVHPGYKGTLVHYTVKLVSVPTAAEFLGAVPERLLDKPDSCNWTPRQILHERVAQLRAPRQLA